VVRRVVHWLLVRLMSWYDEPSHLEEIDRQHAKVRRADRLLRDAAMRADAARARARMVGRL